MFLASGKICGRSTGNDAEFNLIRDKGTLEILRGSTSVDDLILKLSLLDFVVEHDGKVLPIEVKSGKGYTRHTALDNAMRVEEYSIPEAFVFSSANVSVDGNVVCYPIYMAMFLKEEVSSDAVLPLSKFPF